MTLLKYLNIVQFMSFFFYLFTTFFFTIKSHNQVLFIYSVQIFLSFFVLFYLFNYFYKKASYSILNFLSAKFSSFLKLSLYFKSNYDLFALLF